MEEISGPDSYSGLSSIAKTSGGALAATAPVLRPGTSESFCLSWGGNAVPSGTSLYITLEWTEE